MDVDGNASAIVLAGGKSSRMAKPKALLRFGNEPLISRIACALKTDFDGIVVVAAPEQELPVLPAPLVRYEVPFQRARRRHLLWLEGRHQRDLLSYFL